MYRAFTKFPSGFRINVLSTRSGLSRTLTRCRLTRNSRETSPRISPCEATFRKDLTVWPSHRRNCVTMPQRSAITRLLLIMICSQPANPWLSRIWKSDARSFRRRLTTWSNGCASTPQARLEIMRNSNNCISSRAPIGKLRIRTVAARNKYEYFEYFL